MKKTKLKKLCFSMGILFSRSSLSWIGCHRRAVSRFSCQCRGVKGLSQNNLVIFVEQILIKLIKFVQVILLQTLKRLLQT